MGIKVQSCVPKITCYSQLWSQCCW